MGREASINAEQFAAAAASLRVAGNKATNRAVREILGTGSFATIGEFLREWKKKAPAPGVETEMTKLSAALAAERSARIDAERKLAAYRELMEEKFKDKLD